MVINRLISVVYYISFVNFLLVYLHMMLLLIYDWQFARNTLVGSLSLAQTTILNSRCWKPRSIALRPMLPMCYVYGGTRSRLLQALVDTTASKIGICKCKYISLYSYLSLRVKASNILAILFIVDCSLFCGNAYSNAFASLTHQTRKCDFCKSRTQDNSALPDPG